MYNTLYSTLLSRLSNGRLNCHYHSPPLPPPPFHLPSRPSPSPPPRLQDKASLEREASRLRGAAVKKQAELEAKEDQLSRAAVEQRQSALEAKQLRKSIETLNTAKSGPCAALLLLSIECARYLGTILLYDSEHCVLK